MPITLIDNGASIKITDGTLIRNVTKVQIIEVTVIKTNVIKIDIGQGALRNIFIPYADVTLPVTANPGALRDKINDFLAPPASGAIGATEAKQIDQINLLTTLSNTLNLVRNSVGSIDSKTFFDPVLIDDGGVGVVYRGYAVDGASQDQPVWAIERIQKVGDVDVHTWADGNRDFNNSWLTRDTLAYS